MVGKRLEQKQNKLNEPQTCFEGKVQSVRQLQPKPALTGSSLKLIESLIASSSG
jgi:hypothetical protein